MTFLCQITEVANKYYLLERFQIIQKVEKG